MKHNYLVIYEQAEDGSITAYAPELQPGAVVSTGKDYEEARRMIAEAINLYLEEAASPSQSIRSVTNCSRLPAKPYFAITSTATGALRGG